MPIVIYVELDGPCIEYTLYTTHLLICQLLLYT